MFEVDVVQGIVLDNALYTALTLCYLLSETPQSDGSSSGGSSGGLSIAIIGGIIGGVVVAIVIIVVLVVMIVWMRRSQRGKADTVYNDSANGTLLYLCYDARMLYQ